MTLLEQAFADWLANRAYWCQYGGYGSSKGYYRIKGDGDVKNHAAPWSKLVKQTFPDCDDFHRAAHAAGMNNPMYPNGQCQVCGNGLGQGSKCVNPECSALGECNWDVRDTYNKCDDCCPVLECNVCGPCPLHDLIPVGGRTPA